MVLDARSFAIKIGLDPGGSFTKYTRVDKDVLAWILAASRPAAFDLYQWWFPFVGRVPYKGFFDKTDAEKAAADLRGQEYETWIRPTEAFSTLGWFNDPVLTTTLKRPDAAIVETVLHESAHSTVWLPGHVDFNESFANYVGFQGAVDFYETLIQNSSGDSFSDNAADSYAKAQRNRALQFELSEVVMKLFQELNLLYNSDIPTGDKLQKREAVFEKETSSFRAKYPGTDLLSKLNNAEIVQLKLYLTALRDFEALYRKHNRDWSAFISAINRIAKESKHGRAPFELLKQEICRDLQP